MGRRVDAYERAQQYAPLPAAWQAGVVLGINIMTTTSRPVLSDVKRQSLLIMAMCFLSISGCQADNNSKSQDFLTVVQMGKIELELYSQQDQCAIRFKGASVTKLLDIPYPCGFVRAGEELVAQSYHYEGVGDVFVVAGSLADKKSYTEDSGVSPEHKCSNQGQAIVVQGGTLVVRPGEHVPLGFCHELGFDEKDYYGYAYPVH